MFHAPVQEQLRAAVVQEERLKASLDEANPDVDSDVDSPQCPQPAAVSDACFADSVYATPSAYIAALVAALPTEEALTRDQTLFIATFADICDQVWSDETEQRMPCDRKVHHILLLGQGGSGKTHVVQKILFRAVKYIWPAPDKQRPTLMVVASSNAQAKNISTQDVKARTVHNACAMRVQKYENKLMQPGRQQKALTKLWESVRVLVVEEVSRRPPALPWVWKHGSSNARLSGVQPEHDHSASHPL